MWNKKLVTAIFNLKQNKLYKNEKANFKDIKRSSQKSEILTNYMETTQKYMRGWKPNLQKDQKPQHDKAEK